MNFFHMKMKMTPVGILLDFQAINSDDDNDDDYDDDDDDDLYISLQCPVTL